MAPWAICPVVNSNRPANAVKSMAVEELKISIAMWPAETAMRRLLINHSTIHKFNN